MFDSPEKRKEHITGFNVENMHLRSFACHDDDDYDAGLQLTVEQAKFIKAFLIYCIDEELPF